MTDEKKATHREDEPRTPEARQDEPRPGGGSRYTYTEEVKALGAPQTVYEGQIVRSKSLHDRGQRYRVRHVGAVIFEPLDGGVERVDAMSGRAFPLNFEAEDGWPLAMPQSLPCSDKASSADEMLVRAYNGLQRALEEANEMVVRHTMPAGWPDFQARCGLRAAAEILALPRSANPTPEARAVDRATATHEEVNLAIGEAARTGATLTILEHGKPRVQVVTAKPVRTQCPECSADLGCPVCDAEPVRGEESAYELVTRAIALAEADGAKLARAEMHAFGWRINERGESRPETPGSERLCFHASKGKKCTRYIEGANGERREIVRWLRSDEQARIGCSAGGIARLDQLANAIEKGEHLTTHEKGEAGR